MGTGGVSRTPGTGNRRQLPPSRRKAAMMAPRPLSLRAAIRTAAVVLAAMALPATARAEPKVKIGLMLPYTGTYAALGNAITNGFKLFVAESGGKLGGREIEYFTVDD